MYYEVFVTSHRYAGHEALTYYSKIRLPLGSVVQVTLRRAPTPAIVIAQVTKPAFSTKPIDAVLVTQPLPTASLELLQWLRTYYPSPLGPLTSQFVPKLLTKHANQAPAAVATSTSTTLPALTGEQAKAIDQIQKQSTQRSWWLHGETGSGKTRIYQELLRNCLQQQHSALLLTPEIGLTPQLAREIQQAAGNYPVILWHSDLTDKERREAWLQVLEAKRPVVVVGARSALFLPFQKLGLIVLDEAHDQAYKQEQAPYYNGLRVAGRLAQLHQCLLLMGSATPPVSEYYWAQQKNVPILRLKDSALPQIHGSVTTEVVNLTDRDQFSRDPHLSDRLLHGIENALRNREQALVFLNRRGTARLVLCQNCAWQALCPNCDLPLTYHGDGHLLRCHTCGHNQPAPPDCPVCGSTDIVYRSIGTKTLASTLARLFPNANVQRFDTDNLKHERLESHFSAVQAGRVEILVGTQLLVKGLDLPKLSLVGIVAADTSLYFPDYTAEEQSYQLLTQVMGRVGRGHRAGTVVIQTYSPDNPALQAALHRDWPTFYQQQLAERRTFLFPPFCFLLKLSCRRKSADSARRAAQKLMTELTARQLPVQFIGPSPSFIERQAGYYRWQIVAKSKHRPALLRVVQNLPAGWSYDLDPSNLL
jgi:primosomal protein N' (replication factor Y)